MPKQKVLITVLLIGIVSFSFVGAFLIININDTSDALELYNLYILMGHKEYSKAAWYTQALTMLQNNYTEVKMAIVYHERFETGAGDWADLRINSSIEALDAYRTGINSTYFLGKEGLNISSLNQKIFPNVSGCYAGFFPGWGDLEEDVNAKEIYDFEGLINKSVAAIPFSNFWGENYTSNIDLNIISDYGAIPLLRLMPWGDPYWWPPYAYQENFSLQKIIDGEFDIFLQDWANELKNYGKPVLITFGVEMNGFWFPWSGIFQGGSTTDGYGDPAKADGPERFVDAYIHVWEVFNNSGAKNVTWYWHPNQESLPDESWNSIDAYYPGDEYVDWIALSVYGAQSASEPWVSFRDAFDQAYNKIITDFPNKPLMIAEWGVREP